MLNLAQLSFIAFPLPLLGIIVPLVVWVLKKDKVKNVNDNGKAILDFQITWALFLFSYYIFLVLSIFLLWNSSLTLHNDYYSNFLRL